MSELITRLLGCPDGKYRMRLRLFGPFLVTLLLLGACSGGGGGSGASDSLPNSPTQTLLSESHPANSGEGSGALGSLPNSLTQTPLSESPPDNPSTPPYVYGNARKNSGLLITPEIRLHSARFDPVVLLQWSAPSGTNADSILRYEYRMDGGPWQAASGTRTRHLVDGLEDGTTHYFEVQAVINGADNIVSDKHPVPEHPPSTNDPQPDAPLNFRAQGAKGSVLLTWERPVPKVIQAIPESRESIAFYMYRIGSGAWQVTRTRSAHLVTGLQDNQSYTFTLKAVSNHGIGEATTASATTTGTTTAPDAPQRLTATLDGHFTDLRWAVPLWDGGADITSYQYRVNSGGWQSLDSYSYSTVDCPYRCLDAATIRGLSSGDLVQVRAVNSVGQGAASNAATVSSLPRLSVADASAREGVYETIDFVVTLEPAANTTVTVTFATVNGTARSGSDYTALSDTLQFTAGQTTKTVSVALLDDEINESQESFTLELSNAQGALIFDGEATGTIVNADAMPGAWVTRFGRTVGFQAVDAIEGRIFGARGTRVVVAGTALGAFNVSPDRSTAQDEFSTFGDPVLTRAELDAREVDAKEFLGTSAFQFSASSEKGEPSWTAWGQFSWDEFEAEDQGLDLQSEVSSGFVGADVSGQGWLAGVAVGVSEGDGEYASQTKDAASRLDARLTGVYPYARVGVSERVDIWGLVGYGRGALKLGRGEAVRADLDMRMGALGVRSDLASDAFDLAMKSDVVWVRTESDAVDSEQGRLNSTRGEVNRFRLLVSAAKLFDLDPGKTVTPTMEIGLRHDGGDAETGTGLETKAGITYAAGRITIEGEVHGLLAHEESGYEAWGASGSIQMRADSSGRGLALAVSSREGMAPGDAMQLWSDHQGSARAGREAASPRSTMKATLSYGLGLKGIQGILTPFIGHSILAEGARISQIGGRWQLGHARLNLEGQHREAGFGEAPENSLILNAALHW